MSVDRDEVRRIADLAKLDLDDAEADRLAVEMSRVLEHAERLRLAGSGEPGARPGDHAHGARAGGRDIPGREAAGPQAPDGAGPEGPDPNDSAPGPDGPDPHRGAPDGPDPLHRAPADFAPDMREDLFAVPPPPGVTFEDAADS